MSVGTLKEVPKDYQNGNRSTSHLQGKKRRSVFRLFLSDPTTYAHSDWRAGKLGLTAATLET